MLAEIPKTALSQPSIYGGIVGRSFVVYVSAFNTRPPHTESQGKTLGQFSFLRDVEKMNGRELSRAAKRASCEGKISMLTFWFDDYG